MCSVLVSYYAWPQEADGDGVDASVVGFVCHLRVNKCGCCLVVCTKNTTRIEAALSRCAELWWSLFIVDIVVVVKAIWWRGAGWKMGKEEKTKGGGVENGMGNVQSENTLVVSPAPRVTLSLARSLVANILADSIQKKDDNIWLNGKYKLFYL